MPQKDNGRMSANPATHLVRLWAFTKRYFGTITAFTIVLIHVFYIPLLYIRMFWPIKPDAYVSRLWFLQILPTYGFRMLISDETPKFLLKWILGLEFGAMLRWHPVFCLVFLASLLAVGISGLYSRAVIIKYLAFTLAVAYILLYAFVILSCWVVGNNVNDFFVSP
jgi:hypothetical protein